MHLAGRTERPTRSRAPPRRTDPPPRSLSAPQGRPDPPRFFLRSPRWRPCHAIETFPTTPHSHDLGSSPVTAKAACPGVAVRSGRTTPSPCPTWSTVGQRSLASRAFSQGSMGTEAPQAQSPPPAHTCAPAERAAYCWLELGPRALPKPTTAKSGEVMEWNDPLPRTEREDGIARRRPSLGTSLALLLPASGTWECPAGERSPSSCSASPAPRRHSTTRTDVHEATDVLQPLHGAALGQLLLVLLGDLGGLATHLTGTGQGAVHLTCKPEWKQNNINIRTLHHLPPGRDGPSAPGPRCGAGMAPPTARRSPMLLPWLLPCDQTLKERGWRRSCRSVLPAPWPGWANAALGCTAWYRRGGGRWDPPVATRRMRG